MSRGGASRRVDRIVDDYWQGDAVGKPQGDRRDAARMSRDRSTDAAGRIVRAASGQHPFPGEIYFGEREYAPLP